MRSKNENLRTLRNIKDTLYERGKEIDISKAKVNKLQDIINEIEEMYYLLEQTVDMLKSAEDCYGISNNLSDRVKEFLD